jgi:hypothetical protein
MTSTFSISRARIRACAPVNVSGDALDVMVVPLVEVVRKTKRPPGWGGRGDARGEWAGYVYRRITTIERATTVLLIARDSATDPGD